VFQFKENNVKESNKSERLGNAEGKTGRSGCDAVALLRLNAMRWLVS